MNRYKSTYAEKNVTVFDYQVDHYDLIDSFKIIVSKNEDNKEQFFAIQPTNEKTKLGEGQSVVYLGINLETGEEVAVKEQKPNSPVFEEDLQRERENLQDKHELLGTAIEGDITKPSCSYYTIMKLYKGDNLLEFLYETDQNQKKGSLNYYKAKKNHSFLTKIELTKHVISETYKLHKISRLLHRDIKTANFQTFSLGNRHPTTLIDLGAAVKKGEMTGKEIVGSLGYIAIEQLLPIKERPDYSANYDKWSLGVVIAEIWTKHNYQSYLLSQPENAQLFLLDIHGAMPDVFSKQYVCNNAQEKQEWKTISRIISGLLDELPTFRLRLSKALKEVNKLFSGRVKSEIEQLNPKLHSEKEIVSYQIDKLIQYRMQKIATGQLIESQTQKITQEAATLNTSSKLVLMPQPEKEPKISLEAYRSRSKSRESQVNILTVSYYDASLFVKRKSKNEVQLTDKESDANDLIEKNSKIF
jgi:serine/threonine protein kinase